MSAENKQLDIRPSIPTPVKIARVGVISSMVLSGGALAYSVAEASNPRCDSDPQSPLPGKACVNHTDPANAGWIEVNCNALDAHLNVNPGHPWVDELGASNCGEVTVTVSPPTEVPSETPSPSETPAPTAIPTDTPTATVTEITPDITATKTSTLVATNTLTSPADNPTSTLIATKRQELTDVPVSATATLRATSTLKAIVKTFSAVVTQLATNTIIPTSIKETKVCTPCPTCGSEGNCVCSALQTQNAVLSEGNNLQKTQIAVDIVRNNLLVTQNAILIEARPKKDGAVLETPFFPSEKRSDDGAGLIRLGVVGGVVGFGAGVFAAMKRNELGAQRRAARESWLKMKSRS